MGAQVDQLEASMNRAAEAAVPQAQGLLVEAVKNDRGRRQGHPQGR